MRASLQSPPRQKAGGPRSTEDVPIMIPVRRAISALALLLKNLLESATGFTSIASARSQNSRSLNCRSSLSSVPDKEIRAVRAPAKFSLCHARLTPRLNEYPHKGRFVAGASKLLLHVAPETETTHITLCLLPLGRALLGSRNGPDAAKGG
jgi:hypothetical protein